MLGVVASSRADAQFGGLGKLKDKLKPKELAKEQSGMIQAKMTLDWKVEMTSVDKVPRQGADNYQVKGTATRTLLGTVNAALNMGAEALPDGPLARATSQVNPLYSIMFATQTGSGDLASMSGTATHTLRIVETGAPCKATYVNGLETGWVLSNPGKLSATGQIPLSAKNTKVSLSFRGDAPTSANVFIEPVVTIKGRSSDFSCGANRPANYTGVLSRDQDYTEPPIALNFALTTNAPGCDFQKSRAGNVLTLTGRCEQNDGSTRIVTTTKFTWDAPPPPAGTAKMADAPKLEAGKGTITFTQNGKEATWPMNSAVNMSGPVTGVSLMFTPDGGQPSEERGVLSLTLINVMGRAMIAINLAKGPAGDDTFEAEHCTAESSSVGGKTQGKGECKNGKSSVKFTFSGSR